LRRVQVTADVADGDRRDVVRVDEPEMLWLEQFQPPGGRLFIPAQVALDAPVLPASTVCPTTIPSKTYS
jgi:hypothetical protein